MMIWKGRRRAGRPCRRMSANQCVPRTLKFLPRVLLMYVINSEIILRAGLGIFLPIDSYFSSEMVSQSLFGWKLEKCFTSCFH